MGFPQLPTWVSNFVKNIPRTFPTEAVSSAAKAIAQTMPSIDPVTALVPEYDPCADLALEELAQMPMELIDPEGRKNWCRDYLEQKRVASLPQPDPLAVFNKAIPVLDKTTPPDGKTSAPFTYRSVQDLLKRDSSGFLPLLPSNTGGSNSTPNLLHNTPQEAQIRETQANFFSGLNRLTNGGDDNNPSTPPGSGFPGISGQAILDGWFVVTADSYWEQKDNNGEREVASTRFPSGWNDPAPQIQFGSAAYDFHLPGFPGVPNLPEKPKDPDDFDAEEWEKNNQELGRLGLRMLFWPLDLLASAREYERDKSLGNLIYLILSGLPIVGLLGDIGKVASKLSETAGNLLRKIPGVNWAIDKMSEFVRGIDKIETPVVEIPRGKLVDPDPSPFQIRVDPNFPDRPDPKWSIDTRTFDPNLPSAGKTASQEVRDLNQFWGQWIDMDKLLGRQTLSEENLKYIEYGYSPRVDDTWLEYFPEHKNYWHQKLEHHHVNYGRYAIPLPNKVHRGRGSSGIWHNR
jgi:hypothetical protein